jgi:hypothetical protein
MIRELKEGGGCDERGLEMIVTDESGGGVFVFPFEFFQ